MDEVLILSKLTFARKERHYKNLIVAGGVIANDFLKEHIAFWCAKNNMGFLRPEKSLATDNAVMIGLAAAIGIENGYVDIIKPSDERLTTLAPDGDWSLNTI
jgi:tRNA A37 threonylcarbamoyltransferase TsaD